MNLMGLILYIYIDIIYKIELKFHYPISKFSAGLIVYILGKNSISSEVPKTIRFFM